MKPMPSQLVEHESALPLAPEPSSSTDTETGLAVVIERLAANPDVDVTKLEKIIELQERILHHNAKAAFNAAFVQMEPELPIITEKRRIEVRGQVRSTYAPLEDIHEVVKPIMAKHGFAMRHRTEWPADKPGIIRIVGVLSHAQGHSEESTFEAPMDRSEYRTDIQSMGSTVSYGRRYTTLDLLNLTTRGADNDGQTAAQGRPDLKVPKGFEDWLHDLQAVVDEGLPKLQATWDASRPELRNHLLNTNRNLWSEMKKRAAAITGAKA